MEIKLLHHVPLEVCSDAIRTCWASQDKSDTRETWECECGFITQNYNDMDFDYCGQTMCPKCKSTDIYHHDKIGERDVALIDRVGNKNKHSSTLEHLYYNFHIKGISRAVLQELSRHRIASPSVKSTRYTLKELREEDAWVALRSSSNTIKDYGEAPYQRAEKYLVMTGNDMVDKFSIEALNNLRAALATGISNDIAKYCLPESFKTELAWSINARSLQNFLELRTNKAALWEIRELAYNIFEALPETHKYLFEEYLYPKL